MKKLTTYFSKGELTLWACSAGLVLVSFFLFDRGNFMTLAAKEDISYLSVIICFVMFLVNDLYGFVNWKRMEKRQMDMA